MSKQILHTRTIKVADDSVGTLLEVAGLNANFPYGARVIGLSGGSGETRMTTVSILSSEKSLGVAGVMRLEIAELMKEVGLKPASIFTLLSLAKEAPEVIEDRPVLAVWKLLDFTHEPDFPREYYPYVVKEGGEMRFGLLLDHDSRVYNEQYLFLGELGSGQPSLEL